MKSFWLRLSLPLLFAFSCPAALAEDSLLKIQISGLSEVEGNLYVAVFDSEDDWLGENTVAQMTVVIVDALEGDQVKAELPLPPGEYAFSIFYDENDNGDLDTNFIGIPKEPVALSNNARPRFGPPKYEDAKFDHGAEATFQQISMEKP